jgi:hypothetical protein
MLSLVLLNKYERCKKSIASLKKALWFKAFKFGKKTKF